jgi:hypothetical protein
MLQHASAHLPPREVNAENFTRFTNSLSRLDFFEDVRALTPRIDGVILPA